MERLKVVAFHFERQNEFSVRTENSECRLLEEERRRNDQLDVRKMIYLIDGGEERTKLKEKIMMEFGRSPYFRVDDIHDLTNEEHKERTMMRFKGFAECVMLESEEVIKMRFRVLAVMDPSFHTRAGVHYLLFLKTVINHSTPDLIETHFKDIYNLRMIGCFAMTELGHGSNVAGLETLATYDQTTDEFVIHSPTLTSVKWWIGGAAHSAIHCVCFARLIVHGKDYGVKIFLVPLRNKEDYSLKHGVNIGDCGPKMGRNGTDNGWIQFTNTRIPRINMLMKYTQVSIDGEVKMPAMEQMTYVALISGRIYVTADTVCMAQAAMTIAVRYNAVRCQFARDGDEKETPILNRTNQQYRLMPGLAATYALHFAMQETERLLMTAMSTVQKATGESDMTEDLIEMLKELHATAASMKALATWRSFSIIEECRQACGGNGYSSYSNLPSLLEDAAVQCTWEGDNTILSLQTGRYLLQCVRKMMKGKILPEGVDYLNNLPEILQKRCTMEKKTDFNNINGIVEAYFTATAHAVTKAAQTFSDVKKKGVSADIAFDECSVRLLLAVKLHSIGYVVRRFRDAIKRAESSLVPILQKLCALYGLYHMYEHIGSFIECEYFQPKQIDLIYEQIVTLCKEVRLYAVPLVDAFNYTDTILNSPLGRYDGNVYEALMERVKKPPKSSGVASYFESIIKPILERKETSK